MQEYPGPPSGDPVHAIPVPTPNAPRWRQLGGLATSLTWLFALDIVAAAFVAIAVVRRLGVLNDFENEGISLDIVGRAQDADDLVSTASIIFLVLALGTAVCFITWMWRAAKNNEALGRRGARFGPGWSIGAWFIPLANFVIPVLIMQDLWRGADATTARDASWKEAKRSGLIAAWWTAFLLQLIRFGGGGSADDQTPDLSEIRSSNRVYLVGVVLAIPAAVLAIFVVRRLTERQEQCLEAQQAAWARLQPPPPPSA